MKIALVTGASSGIGRDISIILNGMGYKIILVARNKEKLEEVQTHLKDSEIYICDLSQRDLCVKLYEDIKNKYGNIDVLINNAGFGLFGEFYKTDLETEIKMIDTNVVAMHLLMKLFLHDMMKINKGHILNVASISGFMPGPLMSTYYSTKSYIVRLTQSIYEELKKAKSNVKISVLCPGPVDTNFNNVAKVKFNLRQKNSMEVANYAIKKMFKNKLIIIPGLTIKISRIGAKIIPDKIMAKICYKMQERKR